MDRRSCNCCRLAKCFRVGMQKALILTDGEKEARRQIVEQNREKRGQLTKMKFSDLVSLNIYRRGTSINCYEMKE
jgi:hypothetical protein